MLAIDCNIQVHGSNVFKSIWKCWRYVWGFLCNIGLAEGQGMVYSHKSLWWNLKHKGKPLALLQGFSSRKWVEKGINKFQDVLKEGTLIPWEELASDFGIPSS